jgi:lysophospholipase L1-like esterase
LKYGEEPDAFDVERLKKYDAFEIRNGYYVFKRNLARIPTEKAGSNNFGFRGKEIGPKEKIRILCFGGSATFGHQLTTSFPEKLGELLGDKYEVINCGVVGTTAENIYNLLRDREFVDRLDPDIILVNTFWNTIERYENRVLCNTVDNRFINRLLKNSTLAFLVYKGILFVEYKESSGPFQALRFYIDRICGIATGRNIKVILITEPMILNPNEWAAAPNYPKTHARGDRVFRYFSNKYKGVYFFPIKFFDRTDFTEEEIRAYALDRGHLTEEGYAIEAREIYGQFSRIDWKKGSL